jgi:hypothetical protein
MTSRPRLADDVNFLHGFAAVALFALLAWVFMTAGIGAPQGYDQTVGNVSLTDNTNINVSQARVDFREVDGQTRAALIQDGSVEDRVRVVNGTGYQTATIDRGGEVYAVATVGTTQSIGYAMFDIDTPGLESERFLIAFEIVGIVLVAALVGAVMLARRENDSNTVTALADGGRRLVGQSDDGTATDDAETLTGDPATAQGGED